MKKIKCQFCGADNLIDNKLVIFCSECDKKISNNYIDWKNNTANPDYNRYILEQDDALIETLTFEEPKSSFWSKVLNKNSIAVIILVIGILIFYFYEPQQSISKSTNWETHMLLNEIPVLLPFALEENSTIMPYYLFQYVKKLNSFKSEFSNKMSIVIEEAVFSEYFPITHQALSLIYNEDMQSPYYRFKYTETPIILHIKKFTLRIDKGEYLRHGILYNFENYSFLKNNNVIKLIVSYDSNDSIAVAYNDLISKSVLSNISR
jgi:hypothetical protein